MIEKIKNSPLNLQSTSVYNFNEFSLTELLNKFFSTINKCVDSSNTSLQFLSWLKGEGLPIETEKELNKMYEDGRLTNLIDTLSGDLNQKIMEVNNVIEETNANIELINNNVDEKLIEINSNIETYESNTNEKLLVVNSQLEESEKHKVDWLVSKDSNELLQNLNNGNSHFLTKGLFNINGDITYNGSLEIIGNNTNIEFLNNYTKGVIITNGDYVRIKDVSFKGTNIERLIDITFIEKTVIFEDCNFDDIGRNAIVIDGAEKVVIRSCQFKNVHGNAVTIKNSKNVIFIDNIGENIGTTNGYREGGVIYCDNCNNVTIRGTKALHILDSAIYTNHCNNGKVIITGNTIEDCYKEPIKNQNNGSSTIITDNIINDCLGNGIIAHYCSSDIIIKGNIIEDSCLYVKDEITLNGTILGGISINNVFNFIVENNIIKRVRHKDGCGINIQNYTTNYFNRNKRGIIHSNIITDVANQGIKLAINDMVSVMGNIVTNVCLSPLITGYSKVMVYIQDTIGNISNNIFKQHSSSDGNCKIINSVQVQLPYGLIDDTSIYLNSPITLYVSDRNNVQTKIETKIINVDTSSCKITVENDLGVLIAISNNVKYNIVGNYPNVTYIYRFMQNNKLNLIGNFIEKNSVEDLYRNDDSTTNVITQLENILSYNTVVTI